MAAVGVGSDLVPLETHVTNRAADPVRHGSDLQRERNLLFVSCIRARDAFYLSYGEDPSPFQPAT